MKLAHLILPLLLLPLAACHVYHPVTFKVRDADTHVVIPNATVNIIYQPYLDFSAPRGTSGSTDSFGLVTLDVTNYMHFITAIADGYYLTRGHEHFEGGLYLKVPEYSREIPSQEIRTFPEDRNQIILLKREPSPAKP